MRESEEDDGEEVRTAIHMAAKDSKGSGSARESGSGTNGRKLSAPLLPC